MITINSPKRIDFRKLHLELLPYLGKMELSGGVLTIETTDEAAAK